MAMKKGLKIGLWIAGVVAAITGGFFALKYFMKPKVTNGTRKLSQEEADKLVKKIGEMKESLKAARTTGAFPNIWQAVVIQLNEGGYMYQETPPAAIYKGGIYYQYPQYKYSDGHQGGIKFNIDQERKRDKIHQIFRIYNRPYIGFNATGDEILIKPIVRIIKGKNVIVYNKKNGRFAATLYRLNDGDEVKMYGIEKIFTKINIKKNLYVKSSDLYGNQVSSPIDDNGESGSSETTKYCWCMKPASGGGHLHMDTINGQCPTGWTKHCSDTQPSW